MRNNLRPFAGTKVETIIILHFKHGFKLKLFEIGKI